MSINAELAGKFDAMATALELLGENRFRALAYQKAARVLGEMTVDVGELAKEPAKLLEIEGVGRDLAGQIVEYVNTGGIQKLDDLLAQIPEGVLTLVRVPGIGPKTAAMLWKSGKVESVDDLKRCLASGELEGLPRMGAKTIEKIRKAVEFAEAGGGRQRIGEAMAVAEAVMGMMRGQAGVKRMEYAGSLRRGAETVGDIDLVVGCDDPEREAGAIVERFTHLPLVAEVLAAGMSKSSIRTAGGVQVDLRVVRDDRFGAALMYFTGSKAHNVALRQRAMDMGMKLNEYGLWREGEESEPIAAGTEEAIYGAMKLPLIEPELREDHGELAAALDHRLPVLIKLSDIRAELHSHTTASDGVWSIEELARFAQSRGMETIAVTDHSVSQYQARGLDADRLIAHIAAIHAARKAVKGVTILAGSEVDILPDGSLDYPDELLAELDIVVASPHAALTQDPATATRRLLRAIEHPYVNIIGHPTGRLVLRRPGLAPDIPALCRAAAQTGTALEINANFHRLDLRDSHARTAIEAGVKLAIDTDAHGPTDMDHLIFGIATARRAWATAADVINCLTTAEIRAFVKAKRDRLA
jgi:DNA polymerase (family 10)